jgi:DNA-directed RNA polymerase specialized sigma24 family protein
MADTNDDWFVGIFSRYSRSLRRYLRRYSVSEETAADVAQEAFLLDHLGRRAESPDPAHPTRAPPQRELSI